MFKAKHYRAKAAESAESLKHTDIPSEIREFRRSKESFTALAQNEDWLSNNFDKIIHSQDVPPQDDDAGTTGGRANVAETEEHILRCLGAAVIMQWNTIPTKLQRELFDTAGSMGDVLKSAALRAQIARFLHSHKDEESPAGFASRPSVEKGTLQATPNATHSVCMTDILDTTRVSREEPKLIVRKAPCAPIWSVWAALEGIPSEEIFEGSSEEEASSWINTGGRAWLEERTRKRNA